MLIYVMQRLVREHVCHPLLLWRDAATELSADEFWARYSISRITTEAGMLDIRHSALGILEQLRSTSVPPPEPSEDHTADEHGDQHEVPVHLIHPIDFSTEKTSISLEEMVNTTMALKSNINVDIVKPVSQWQQTLFSTPAPSPSDERSLGFSSDTGGGEVPFHVIQVISGLQRENVLLRNELNFELWLSRENIKHIGRLYQDRIQAKAAETERQGLVRRVV